MPAAEPVETGAPQPPRHHRPPHRASTAVVARAEEEDALALIARRLFGLLEANHDRSLVLGNLRADTPRRRRWWRGGGGGAGRPTHQTTRGRSRERRRSAPAARFHISKSAASSARRREQDNATTRRGPRRSPEELAVPLVSSAHLPPRPRPPSARPPAATRGRFHISPHHRSHCALTRGPLQSARASGRFRPTPANGVRRLCDGERRTRSANSCSVMSTGSFSPWMSPAVTPADSALPEHSVT